MEAGARLADPEWSVGFVRALARDGYVLTEERTIRAARPEVADLPGADDEVHAYTELAKGYLLDAAE